MNNVRLCYLNLEEDDIAQIEQHHLRSWLAELPRDKQEAVQRLLHNSDRIISLLATQLLKICVDLEGIPDFCLADVRYPVTGKPMWNSKAGNELDFNITHSGNVIVVAVSRKMMLGVDIEMVRELKSLKFKRVLMPAELESIQKSPKKFFDFWTKKEAVVKAANTAGLSRMHDVQLQRECAVLDDKKWYLRKVELDSLLTNRYVCYLAVSGPVDEVICQKIFLDDLLL